MRGVLEGIKKLEPFYEKARYRFRMATAGERNEVMKLLDIKGYDPTLIEDPVPFTVEISRYRKYGELLKNSVESYPLRDRTCDEGHGAGGLAAAMGGGK